MPLPVMAVEQATGQGSAQRLCCVQSEPGIEDKMGRVRTLLSKTKTYPRKKSLLPRPAPVEGEHILLVIYIRVYYVFSKAFLLS